MDLMRSYASHDLMIEQPLRLGIQRATCSDFWEVVLPWKPWKLDVLSVRRFAFFLHF